LVSFSAARAVLTLAWALSTAACAEGTLADELELDALFEVDPEPPAVVAVVDPDSALVS
jgi:hypothetical protein